MKPIACAALLALTGAGAVPEVEIAFEPGEGLRLRKSFVHAFDLELVEQEARVLVDGEEQELGDEESYGIADEDRVVFVDEVLAVDDDARVTKLRRTFETISSDATYTYGEEVEEVPGESALEGLTVVFTWDPEEEAFDVEFDGEEGDEDLLEELEAPCDLAEFLPDGPVSEGDTWEVAVDAFARLSSPGGDLVILDEGETEADDEFGDEFDENLEGTITCEYEGEREVDGRKLAAILVQAELRTSVEEEADEEDFEGAEVEGTQTFTFEMSLEGVLLWDLAAGHAVSFELVGDAELTIATDQEMEADGTSLEMHSKQRFEGDLSVTVTFE